jgi:hypothetical protein
MAFFGERLKEEGRHEPGDRHRVDAADDAQPLAEAGFLDGEITVEQLDLAGERNLVVLIFERGAEQVAEVADEFVGRIGVAVDEGRDGVEGVEEEVRLQLQAERIEAGLGEAGGERESLAVALLHPAVVGGGVRATEDDQIDRQTEVAAPGKGIDGREKAGAKTGVWTARTTKPAASTGTTGTTRAAVAVARKLFVKFASVLGRRAFAKIVGRRPAHRRGDAGRPGRHRAGLAGGRRH